jgi:hypothetical protein
VLYDHSEYVCTCVIGVEEDGADHWTKGTGNPYQVEYFKIWNRHEGPSGSFNGNASICFFFRKWTVLISTHISFGCCPFLVEYTGEWNVRACVNLYDRGIMDPHGQMDYEA